MLGVHAIATQGIDCSLADLVLGKLADEIGVMAIVGTRYGHVGLAAAPDDVEVVDFDKAAAPCG